MAIRIYLPGAEQVWVARDSGLFPAERVHGEGFFEALFPGEVEACPYRLRARFRGGQRADLRTRSRFPPVLTEYDLYLLGRGNALQIFDKLGARISWNWKECAAWRSPCGLPTRCG